MNDRRHLRRDEDADKEQSSTTPRARRENHENASILDLQASAGNRAVAQLLESREGDPAPAPVQRQWSAPKPAPAPEPTDRGPTPTGTMTIPDVKLTMPIISFSYPNLGARDAKDKSGVVDVKIPLERADAWIYGAVSGGRHFDTITIANSRQTVTLHSVVISNMSIAHDMAQISLSYTSMEFKLGA